MTAIYIIGIIIGLIIFLGLGYYLWDVSLEKYNYNIFNLGVIIRGLLAIGCLWLAGIMTESEDGSTMVWLITSVVLWLWTFLVTAFRTNIFIAIFSIIYQLFAVFLIKSAINRLLK